MSERVEFKRSYSEKERGYKVKFKGPKTTATKLKKILNKFEEGFDE